MSDKQIPTDTALDADPAPTARVPWTVTLGWAPQQNFGRVSVMPGRSPVFAMWGRLAAGESPDAVAADYGLTAAQVQVLDVLRHDAETVLLAEDHRNDAAVYPDTRFLTLCTLGGRKSGRVTVGESRLPVATVLGLIRAHGVGEAATMWPHLSREELDVLAQLAVDLDVASAGLAPDASTGSQSEQVAHNPGDTP